MWKSVFKRDRPPAPAQAPAPAVPAEPFGERMNARLEEIGWDARRAGGRLPIAALPQLGRIEDVLHPLLDHLVANPPSVDEEIAVQAMLTDYLPTTIGTYVGMNRQFAETPRADGRTPGDDLLEQLVMLEGAAHELSLAVYAHDAQQLATHGRFLSTKFSGSDLDL
ncbi:MAG: hypothetical protein QOF69_3647 [Solirubrobacteraceae bacterium]|jgi:hypothetical protein|nr:hypothetical protein [Solirubrobacteraceae bacterium]